jgi:hypothetical protein
MAIGIVLGAIMVAQIAGTVVGSINSAQKAGQHQCKIQQQIEKYDQILDQVNGYVAQAQDAIKDADTVKTQFQNINAVIATMRLNELEEQDDIISSYKTEVQKINIISLSFIGSIFVIFLVNFILRLKKPNNC